MTDLICQDCGQGNPVWFAPDALWNSVMGGAAARDDPGGVVCPNCFIRRADHPGAWSLSPSGPIEITTQSAYRAMISATPDTLED